MSINYEFKKNIEEKTRLLGTSADSYLKDFFETYRNDFSLRTANDIVKNSKRSERSKAVKRQFKEILFIFGLINKNEEIICNKYGDENEFKHIITTNIKIKLKNNIPSAEWISKNTYKLFNNLIYFYGIEVFKEREIIVENLKDIRISKKISEFKSNFIIPDENFKELIFKKFKLLLESCNFKLETLKSIREISINKKISDFDYNPNKIENYKKNGFFSEVRNIFELIEFILDKNKIISIPFFQREYVWPENLIENFLNEIFNKNELNIGSILFSIQKLNVGDKNKYVLIDGQQRVVSIILIVNYLAKSINLENFDKKDLPFELKNILEKCKDSKILDFFHNESNEEFENDLKRVINAKPEIIQKSKDKRESNILKNYGIIVNKISDLDYKSKLNLFKKLSYVFLTFIFDNKSNEIDLFISTNSSRVELSNFELIRSFLISKIKNDERKDEIKKKIKVFTKNLNEISEKNKKIEDTFINFFLFYSDLINLINLADEKINEENLFKKFKMIYDLRILKNEDLILLLDEMDSILKSYKVIKGKETISGIYLNDFILSLGEGLKRKSIFDVFLIYFVEILKSEKNEKNKALLLNEFRKILVKLEEFNIKWKLFEFSGDSLTNALSLLFKKFYRKCNDQILEKKYDEIFLTFKNILFEKKNLESFVSSILNKKEYRELGKYLNEDNLELKKNEIALKILNRVAFNLFNNKSIEYNYNTNNYFEHLDPTIEHIFPKKEKRWKENNDFDIDNLILRREDIGNKFILNKKENSAAGNKTFAAKMEHYKKYNNLQLDKTLTNFNFFEKNSWTSKDIENRTKFIIEEILKIWNYY